jgi:hypothetical protein
MNLREQYAKIEQFYDDALAVIRSRQSDYAPTGVALLNVLDTCVRWDMTPLQALGVLLDKQTTALQHLCVHGHVNSDPPLSRLCDSANYFALFYMYLSETDAVHEGWRQHWLSRACRCDNDTMCQRCATLNWLTDHAAQTR